MNETLVVIVIAAVILVLAIIIWIASRRRRESALDTLRAKSRAAHEPALASDTFSQVRELMAQDEKIEAIKMLREKTGMGLAEAKAAVERLDEGGNLDNPLPASPAPAQLPVELAATVRGLLQNGDKIGAIKLVRVHMKLDLKDAKDLVDRFE